MNLLVVLLLDRFKQFKTSLLACDYLLPNWIIIAPQIIIINPIQVVFGIFSLNTKRPNNMLISAKNAT
jgi:hypothetical protein